MNVSAIIVTRGDVDLDPVFDSLPDEWEKIEWNNGKRAVYGHPPPSWYRNATDLSVYGRYAAIEHASHDLIYVQDDDVIVSDPQAIVDCWKVGAWDGTPRYLVANMPQEFRHDGYTDSCLVGFGACFHRNAVGRAWLKWSAFNDGFSLRCGEDFFYRTCDVVFTTLTPRVLVDVPKTDREFASDPGRMWKQPEHYGERVKMLELARRVRDG